MLEEKKGTNNTVPSTFTSWQMEIGLTGSSSKSEDGAAPCISSRQLSNDGAVDTDEEVMVVGEKTLETRLLEGAKHAIDLLDSPV